MRHNNYDSEFKADLKSFEEMKPRFKFLHDEVQAIHENWRKLHQGPEDEDHLQQHSELINHELEVIRKLQQLLNSADELMRHNLHRIDKGLITIMMDWNLPVPSN